MARGYIHHKGRAGAAVSFCPGPPPADVPDRSIALGANMHERMGEARFARFTSIKTVRKCRLPERPPPAGCCRSSAARERSPVSATHSQRCPCSVIDSSVPKAVARAGLCRANISRGIPRGRRASLCTATAMLASVDDTHRRSWEGVTYTRANGVRGWARLWCILGARRAACAPMAFSRFLRLWLGNGERHCSEQTRRRRRRMAVGRSRRAEAQQARVGDEVCIG